MGLNQLLPFASCFSSLWAAPNALTPRGLLLEGTGRPPHSWVSLLRHGERSLSLPREAQDTAIAHQAESIQFPEGTAVRVGERGPDFSIHAVASRLGQRKSRPGWCGWRAVGVASGNLLRQRASPSGFLGAVLCTIVVLI